MSTSPSTTEMSGATPIAIYTPEQRARRDGTRWTMVQGIMAPIQFAIFAVSICLVFHALATGRDVAAANASVLAKTAALLAIMVTGAIWEKRVFGRYLLAPAFFWEDVGSFAVIALHLGSVAVLFTGALTETGTLLLALLAYAAYCVNAAQFVLKLRSARREALA